MPGVIDSLVSSPTGRRTLEQLRIELRSRRVALFLGAGTDIAMSDASNWSDLVSSLFQQTSAPPEASKLSSWTIELAAVARQLLGEDEYHRKIQTGIGSTTRASPYWAAFENFSRLVPLIVTTNYSRWIFDALSRGNPPTVVDRTTLRSTSLPEPGAQFDRPTLVHLHGRGTEVVLDRFGYDHAQFHDPLYGDFLTQLFERWTVLALGTSLSDPPIRFAASLARFRRPELSRTHVWIDKTAADEPYRWHSRATFISCAVRRIECSSHAESAQLAEALSLESLPNLADARSRISAGDYKALADVLDSAGDYESRFQRSLFRNHSFTRGLCTALLSCDDAMLLARLERHLRHHAQLIQPRSISVRIRKALWLRVVALIGADPAAARTIQDNPRLHLDFLLGGFEVGEVPELNRFARPFVTPSDPLFASRLARADQIWTPRDRDPRRFGDLKMWAAEVGWEAMEAKATFDQARAQAESAITTSPSNLSARAVDEVISIAGTSLRAAQYAGTLRRVVGSLIIQSLWLHFDNAEAKAVLRSAVALAQRNLTLEKTLTDALAWAWQRLFENPGEAFEDVAWTAPPSPKAMMDQETFWKNVTPFPSHPKFAR